MDNTVSSLTSSTLLEAPPDRETSDAQLLREFVTEQDEAAFATLVRRHGGLVRGVCRRILTDPAAADDAFQQTFLSLSQHAPVLLRSVAPSASLASWLYRVAVNASLQWKRKSVSRRRTETQFAAHRPAAEKPAEPWNEVLPALDEEISSLPGQYRLAVVKCHLEGKTQQDAAEELGITYATLRRRLKAARGMLRNRLSERGFTKAGFLLLPLLGTLAAPQSVSAQTVTTVTKTVLSKTATSATTASVSGAASAGTSVSLGTKLLALNPLIKLTTLAAVLTGAVGGWWIAGSDSSPEPGTQIAQSQAGETAEASTRQNGKKEPAEDDEGKEPDAMGHHFAYVLQNGRVVSPEFESAADALTDSQAQKNARAERVALPPPRKVDSQKLFRDVNLGVPLPRDTDLLSQSSQAGLSEDVSQIDLTDPNAELLVAESEPDSKGPDAEVQKVKSQPPSKPDPLTAEQVMDLLNEAQQRRRSQTRFKNTPPASPHVLGHPAPKPAKTLKVIALP